MDRNAARVSRTRDTMSELQRNLKEKIEELESIRKVRVHISQLQNRLSSEANALVAMEKTLEKEQKDVETMEKEGLMTMFHKFLGDREDKLDKERQEYLKASLKYNELYKSVELIRFELDLLSKKEQNLQNVERQVEVLMKQREEEIMTIHPQIALQLTGINQQADKLHKFLLEIEEALRAGEQALDFVRKTENYLTQARQLGQVDMWGSRNIRSGTFKHQAMDQAREMAYQSKHALIRFGNELKDVYNNLRLDIKMDIEEFGRFMDVFFDNLLSDWLVQQKIMKSLANVSATRQQVEDLMQQLNQEKDTVKTKQKQLEVQRKDVIISADS